MNLDAPNRLLDEAEDALESASGGRYQAEVSFIQRLLCGLGADVSLVGLSPAELLSAIRGNGPLARDAQDVLEILALPLQRPTDALRSGDWLLRAAPGTGDVGHVSVVASDDLLTPAALASEGIAAESAQPGYYGVVIEAGAFPHSRSRPFARRLLDSRGRVPLNTMVLRPRYSDVGMPMDLPPEVSGAGGAEAENFTPLHGPGTGDIFRPTNASGVILRDMVCREVGRQARDELQRWRTPGGGVIHEGDVQGRAILAADYWPAAGVANPNTTFGGNWWSSQPWSAAFVSYVVNATAARLGLNALLGGAPSHMRYAWQAYRDRVAGRVERYWAYPPDRVLLEAGDIVVKGRGTGSGATWSDLTSSTYVFRQTHGDVVVAVTGTTATVIGGNVSQTVGEGTYALSNRFIDTSSTGNGANRVFAVLKLVGAAETRGRPADSFGTSVGEGVNWVEATPDERRRHVMELLVRKYEYPVNGAAGLVGNLWEESGLLPNRIEGSQAATPMRALNFDRVWTDFTPEQAMNRSYSSRQGPLRPGIGLAQWTSAGRRAGLFRHSFGGRVLGAAILDDLDAQVDYLVSELRSHYRAIDTLLRNPGTSLETASDEIVYSFEVPGSVLTPAGQGPRQRLPRENPSVQAVFQRRRASSRRALQAYRGTQEETYELEDEAEVSAEEDEQPGEPDIDVQKAIRSNRIYGQQLGWRTHYDTIAKFLGLPEQSSEREFALGVARWQQSKGLNTDGMVGPSTWTALLNAEVRSAGAGAIALPKRPSGVRPDQSWVDVKRKEGLLGQIFFETGSAELDWDALAELDKFSCYDTIVNAPGVARLDFEFHGFADHRRFAKEGGNLKLSENRAEAVWDRVVNVLSSGVPSRLETKYKGKTLGFGVDPLSTRLPKDPKILKVFRRVDILGPACELPPEKKEEDEPSGTAPSPEWMARILGKGTIKAVAAADLTLLEIVDRKSGLSKEFWYRGAGLGAGSGFSTSPSDWVCFSTSKAISINDFEGFASQTTGSFVTPLGAKLELDMLTLTGPWMNARARVVHLIWRDFSLGKGKKKKGGIQAGTTVGGLHPCKPGEPVCTPLKKLKPIPPCP